MHATHSLRRTQFQIFPKSSVTNMKNSSAVLVLLIILLATGPRTSKNAEARTVITRCFTDDDCYKVVKVPPGVRAMCIRATCIYLLYPPILQQNLTPAVNPLRISTNM